MKEAIPLKIGSIVYSKMGRDKGRYFVVFSIDGGYVKIVDGDIRKISNPKKKKIIHIKNSGAALETIANKIEQKKQLHDKEIISALKIYNVKTEA
jgi:ribosomal protein L14E/L6E/L27E